MKKLILILTVLTLSSCSFNEDLEPYGIVTGTESVQIRNSDNVKRTVTTATIDFQNMNVSNHKLICDESVSVGDTLYLTFKK